MKKVLPLICLLGCFSGSAQIKNHQLRIGAVYNVIGKTSKPAKISSVYLSHSSSTITNTGTIKDRFKGGIGLNVIWTFDYTLSSRFFLTSGLSINYLRYKRSTLVEFPSTDQSFAVNRTNVPIGSYFYPDGYSSFMPASSNDENLGKTTTLYLQIPVLAGTTFLNNKFFVRGGFTASYLVDATQYQQTYSPTSGLKTSKVSSNSGFTSLLAGITIQSTYLITKQIGLSLSAERSLTSIYKTNDQTPRTHQNLLSFGVSYSFME